MDLNNVIVKQLKKQKPKDGDSGTYDVSLSSAGILSQINYVLKTGIEPWDVLSGGLAFGRIAELYGTESCGKTAMCIRSAVKAGIGNIYHRYKEDGAKEYTYKKLAKSKIEIAILYVDNEQSIDEDNKITVDGDKLECAIARCDTIDQMFKMADVVINKIAEAQEAELKRAKEKKEDPVLYFIVMVVDTIAASSSKEEMSKDWNKTDYQRQPKMLREGFRRISRDINRHNVLMLCTNQVSEKFSQQKSYSNTPQDSDYATFGGRALKYYASQRFFMYKLNDGYKIRPAKFPQGYLVGFYTSKNRVTKPCRSARLVILFEGGLSNEMSKFETMLFLGLITYSKSTKRFCVRFSKNNVAYAGAPTTTLEDDDDRGKTGGDPELENKGDWLTFSEQHKNACQALWEIASKLIFDDSIIPDVVDEEDSDDEDLDT